MGSDNANRLPFLSRLVKEAVDYGWEGDYAEVYNFVAAIHERYMTEVPDSLSAPFQHEMSKD